MNEKTLEALKGSIAKWEAIVAGTGADGKADNCPLCARFDEEDWDEGHLRCATRNGELCPVSKRTDRAQCMGSPYEEWSRAAQKIFGYASERTASTPELVALAQAELDFLKSLLPEGA